MARLRIILANLARLESPRLVLRECALDRRLRDASFEDLATELQDLRGDRSPFAGRQRKVLGVFAEIQSLMSCFRKVDSLEGLAVCARHRWYWDELFGDLARALLEDAVNDDDKKTREVLERALEIHADARSRAARLNELLAARDSTVFPEERELIDDAFLDWMCAQARCRFDEAPSEVGSIWHIVEMLEFAGRIARELQRFQKSTPSKNGMYELRQPLPTRETLFWFVTPATHRKMEEVATRVVDGSIGLDNALIEIVRFVRKVRPPRAGGDKASRTLWGRSAFLLNAAWVCTT